MAHGRQVRDVLYNHSLVRADADHFPPAEGITLAHEGCLAGFHQLLARTERAVALVRPAVGNVFVFQEAGLFTFGVDLLCRLQAVDVHHPLGRRSRLGRRFAAAGHEEAEEGEESHQEWGVEEGFQRSHCVPIFLRRIVCARLW